MDKEYSKENEELRTGLDLSDTQDYDVLAGIADESFGEGEPEKKEKGSSGSNRGVFAFTAGFISCLAVLFVLCYVFGLGMFLSKSQFEHYKELGNKYGKYEEIMQLIEDDPIADYDGDEMSDARLKEIVASIGDPYAEYYTADEYDDFLKRYLGDYVGIGIVVSEEDGKVVIMGLMKDKPAEEAGLKENDIIKAVDGKEPKDVDDAIDMISGEAGTPVTLTIERDGESFDVTLSRVRIEEESVYYT
jgi:carboxyl-terminal processing protease